MEQNNQLASAIKCGFKYTVEHYRNGVLLDESEDFNLIPTEGLNHILNTVLKAGAQVPSWYVGIYEGNYVPVDSVTGNTIVAASTECTAYTEPTRPEWIGGLVEDGFVTNDASKAEFTINATKSVYGGFLVSSSVKGAGGQTLLSAVRFSTVKNVESGDILRVRAEFTAVSAV